MSTVRTLNIAGAAACKAFDILAPSPTLWSEKDPERRDSLISTTALEAGKWVRTKLAYSNMPHHCSSAVTCGCRPKEAIADSSVQRCCQGDGTLHDAKSKACPILLVLVG